MIALTKPMAAELLAWRERAASGLAIPCSDHDGNLRRVDVVLLGPNPPIAVLELLMARLGPKHLLSTRKGMGFEVEALQPLIEEATHRGGEGERRNTSDPIGEALVAEASALEAEAEALALDEDAGFVPWRLCDPDAIAATVSRIPKDHRARLKTLERLMNRAHRRLPIATREHVERLRALRTDFPNFGEVIDSLSQFLALRARAGEALCLPPTLMQGPPGLGKTMFCQQLTETLGFCLTVRSLAEVTAGFVLTGSTVAWTHAQTGLIANSLIDLPEDRAPLLLLDELDKVSHNSNFPADRALLGLLEPHSAGRFVDEYLEVDIDARPISYLFTANRPWLIRPGDPESAQAGRRASADRSRNAGHRAIGGSGAAS